MELSLIPTENQITKPVLFDTHLLVKWIKQI